MIKKGEALWGRRQPGELIFFFFFFFLVQGDETERSLAPGARCPAGTDRAGLAKRDERERRAVGVA